MENFHELSLRLKVKFIARLVWAIVIFSIVLVPLVLMAVITKLIQAGFERGTDFLVGTLIKDRFIEAVADSVILRRP